MRLDVTPGLAEAAVRAVLDRRAGSVPRHAADVVNEFVQLGLAKPFYRVAREFPEVGMPRAVLAQARREEGVVPSPRRDELQISLHPDRFHDLDALERFLRHEWMHVADMLDPEFQYPDVPEAGDYPDAVRQRYALLWSILCDARIAASGRAPLRTRAEWRERFDGPDRAFDALWASQRPPHPELWHLSIEPSRILQRFGGLASPGPRTPGQLCPLCGFPTFDWRDAPAEALEAIHAEYPAWRSDQGLCGRCAEVFEVRAGLWR